MSEEERQLALVSLDMSDPAASIRDPAFKALINQGYRIEAHVPATRGDGQEWMMLLSKSDTGLSCPDSVSLRPEDRWLAVAVVTLQAATNVILLVKLFGG